MIRNAVVTGATSFIGSALVQRLLDEGIDTYAIVRAESRNLSALPTDHRKLHLIRANAACPEEWETHIPESEVFYHFAWDGVGPDGRANPETQIHNVQMTLNCLRAAAKTGCKRFVFAGSQAEYGINDFEINEETECRPVIEYGKKKLQVCREAIPLSKQLGIEYAHLRIFSVYGPGDHPWTLVSTCLKSFQEGKTVTLSPCTQKWNFLYVSEAAEIIRLFGDCDLQNEHVFNVAGEETVPLKEYVQQIWEACGKNGKPEYGTLRASKEQPHGIIPNIDRMLRVTGWRQKISFADGIQKML